MNELPSDCLRFLKAGQRLDYCADGTSIGRLHLKHAGELVSRMARLHPDGQGAIDDPYAHLNGNYAVELIDLVRESDDYDSDGLLCWIPTIESFASVDEEHSKVITYTGATWNDIVRDPVGYLDSQWGLGSVPVDQVLPWLWFPFRLDSGDAVLAPYAAVCPLHREALVVDQQPAPILIRVYRRRDPNAWLSQCLQTFPCSGVPLTDSDTKLCRRCHTLEHDWMHAQMNAIPELPAVTNSQGWIQCPGCGIRFCTSDDAVFQDGVHLTCGQRIRVTM
jgi:hypothetical protein